MIDKTKDVNALSNTMNTLREELEEVMKLKGDGGGFHYIQKAQRLGKTAQQARQWYSLLKIPAWEWQKRLSETRYVLDQLNAMGIPL